MDKQNTTSMRTIAAVIALYLSVLAVTAVTLPFRLAELLQLLGSTAPTIKALLKWIFEAPSDAPLNYLFQSAAVWAFGTSSWVTRLPSLLFAVGSAVLFWRLTGEANLRSRVGPFLVFLLFPLHYQAATEGRPYEQAHACCSIKIGAGAALKSCAA